MQSTLWYTCIHINAIYFMVYMYSYKCNQIYGVHVFI